MQRTIKFFDQCVKGREGRSRSDSPHSLMIVDILLRILVAFSPLGSPHGEQTVVAHGAGLGGRRRGVGSGRPPRATAPAVAPAAGLERPGFPRRQLQSQDPVSTRSRTVIAVANRSYHDLSVDLLAHANGSNGGECCGGHGPPDPVSNTGHTARSGIDGPVVDGQAPVFVAASPVRRLARSRIAHRVKFGLLGPGAPVTVDTWELHRSDEPGPRLALRLTSRCVWLGVYDTGIYRTASRRPYHTKDGEPLSAGFVGHRSRTAGPCRRDTQALLDLVYVRSPVTVLSKRLTTDPFPMLHPLIRQRHTNWIDSSTWIGSTPCDDRGGIGVGRRHVEHFTTASRTSTTIR